MSKKPSSRAAKIWARLGQWYGTKLGDQYGPTCPEDWCTVIDRADDERLEKALAEVRRKHIDWPPTLGQFEAAIPRKTFGKGDSIPDRLAVHALRMTNPCEHQKWVPWNYFGRKIDTGEKYPIYETRGVMIPDCETCNKPSHRILVSDLPIERAA